jgi:hypothetical protein
MASLAPALFIRAARRQFRVPCRFCSMPDGAGSRILAPRNKIKWQKPCQFMLIARLPAPRLVPRSEEGRAYRAVYRLFFRQS